MAAKKNAKPDPDSVIEQLMRQNEALQRQNEVLARHLGIDASAPSSRAAQSHVAPLTEKLKVGIRAYGVHLTVVSFTRTYGSAFDVVLKDARGNMYSWRSTSRAVLLEEGQRVVMDLRPEEIDGNQIKIGYGKIRSDEATGPQRKRAARIGER